MKHIICLAIFLGIIALAESRATPASIFQVGAAKVDITPAENELPKGFYSINDRLYCRAVVINNGTTSAVLISIDLGMIPEDLYKKVIGEIEKETGIPAGNIFISPSHTHSAPWNLSSDSPLVEAVKQAKARLQPAKLSYNTGLCYLNINRDVIDPVTRLWTQGPNYEGPSDKTVAVITFRDLKGNPIAVYYNYAMHANTMFMSGAISGDFPGETSKYVEEYYDNKVIALFSSGAAGDQNPISIKPMTDVGSKKTDALLASGKAKELNEAIMMAGMGGESDVKIDPKALERQKHMISSMGQILGEEILRAMMAPQKMDSTLSIFSSQQVITCPGRKRTNVGREGSPGTYLEGDPVHIKLSLLKLGDVDLAAVNAEVYNIIAQHLKQQSPDNHTIFVTITNGAANSGYIPSDDAFQRYTFQVLSSRLEPNYAETSIMNGLLRMIDDAR